MNPNEFSFVKLVAKETKVDLQQRLETGVYRNDGKAIIKFLTPLDAQKFVAVRKSKNSHNTICIKTGLRHYAELLQIFYRKLNFKNCR